MPSRDQPALDFPWDDEMSPAGPPVDAHGREVLVEFLDGTLRSCRVVQWRQWRKPGEAEWRCLLYWSVSGRPAAAWYVYDPEKMTPMGKPPVDESVSWLTE